MKQGQSQSKCLWVARDIAGEIVKGERQEGEAIPGMSIMASKYSVSPETIRRAVFILADRGVVEVKPQSRTRVKSVANALKYISYIEKDNELRNAYRSIREIAGEYKALNARLLDALDYFVEKKISLSPVESPIPNYEIPIPDDSDLIGKTIGELKFWSNTKCTVVGIKRRDETIISPGPCLPFEKGDIIVVIGTAEAVEDSVKLIGQR
jgi:K+/H+ antiporter YhaU regulatory subunit KhtT